MSLLPDYLRSYLRSMNNVRAGMSGRGTRGLTAAQAFRYTGVEGYLLDRGRAYKPQPLTSDELAHVRRVAGRVSRYRLGECFLNAQRVAAADAEGRLLYTEGYALGACIPLQHAWLTLNGKVVDLTWRTGGRTPRRYAAGRILGSYDPEKFAYWGAEFPGVDWGRVWRACGNVAGSVFEGPHSLDLYRGREPGEVFPSLGGAP